ncbi:MAG: hypothetical protein IKJ96_04195 [Alistipes sp.]|nr:hypothetical protein [Alistipes sp.]
MKKYLLILVAAIALVSCEDSFESERELESYTLEELNMLSEGFGVSKIDHDQLIADLTEGAIWMPLYQGSWTEETQKWDYNPIFGVGFSNTQWIFDADGEAVNVSLLYEDSIPKTTYFSHAATWQYDSKTGEIVAVLNENSEEYRLKVLYYESPVLYFSQNDTWNNRLNSYLVDLRQYTKDQAEAEMTKQIEE